MKAFLLPIFSAVIVLAAGCGSSSNVSSDDSGNRNYYDGYSTSETHSAQHVEMKDADAMTYLTFEDYVQSHASGVDIDSNGDRAAGFFVQDDDRKKLLRKYKTALKHLKILDKDGNDLVRRDLM